MEYPASYEDIAEVNEKAPEPTSHVTSPWFLLSISCSLASPCHHCAAKREAEMRGWESSVLTCTLPGEEGRHYLHHWTEILGSGGRQEALNHQTKNVQLFNPKQSPTKEILYIIYISRSSILPRRITRAQTFSPKPKWSLQSGRHETGITGGTDITDGVVASTLVIIFSTETKVRRLLSKQHSISSEEMETCHTSSHHHRLRSLLGATRNRGARIGDSRGVGINRLEIAGEVVRQVNEQRG